jgi:anti-sigma B factor antagonist
MKIDLRKDQHVVIAEPHGDVDGKTASDNQEQIIELLLPQARVVIDFSAIAFMSSTGLRTMLLIYRQAKTSGVRLALANVNKDIRASMSATGFLTFFLVLDGVQASVDAVR